MKYLAIEIGCLECGNATETLGLFDTESEAKQILDPNGEVTTIGVDELTHLAFGSSASLIVRIP